MKWIKKHHRRNEEEPDICLLLEGTYPFVAGGVSSWVHHLVSQISDLTFGIMHISPKVGFFGEKHAYKMPDNVIALQEIGLDCPKRNYSFFDRGSPAAVRSFWKFAEDIKSDGAGSFHRFVLDFRKLVKRAPNAFDFLLAEESWQVMVDRYREEAPKESFLNFFWTWHFAYQPLLNVLTFPIPPAGAYHTVSTGYAGILGAAAKLAWRRPLLLTEHGIYSKERRIEIHSADWIQDWESGEFVIADQAPYFKQFWNEHFQVMGRICYAFSDRIFTLYGDNGKEQVKDGADPDKIEIIPNGIDVGKMLATAARLPVPLRPENDRFTVGFVGRVCPIKDVRTLVAAMRLVAREVPDVRVRILGPMGEDPEYAEDCIRMAEDFGLSDNVDFEGRVNVAEELPKLDVMVMTSISEAQPLVILEAGAMGVPVVATEVGSCRELLEGRSPEDRALGIGGLLTPIASPGSTARAILQLYHDPELRKQMADSLKQRVLRYYEQEDMLRDYEEIYKRAVNKWAEDGSSSLFGPRIARSVEETAEPESTSEPAAPFVGGQDGVSASAGRRDHSADRRTEEDLADEERLDEDGADDGVGLETENPLAGLFKRGKS